LTIQANHPEGTRRFEGAFRLVSAKVRSVGNRVEVQFEGLKPGLFEGGIAYTFYRGSRLIYQEAVVSTQEPNTAYLYDTGLRFAAPATGVRPGRREVLSPVTYYDTDGRLRTEMTTGPDRWPAYVRYRAIAAQLDAGSLAVFPPPHIYIAPRDYTTNMGYVWFHGWAPRSGRGELGLGVRHPSDDGAASYYPWINARPGTVQRLGLFYIVSDRGPEAALDDVLRFTNRDRFPALPGYKTPTAHWHWGYTIQALNQGEKWVPEFPQVLKDMGTAGGTGGILPDVPQAVGFQVSSDSRGGGGCDSGWALVASVVRQKFVNHCFSVRDVGFKNRILPGLTLAVLFRRF
jgi:hypothetical protein